MEIHAMLVEKQILKMFSGPCALKWEAHGTGKSEAPLPKKKKTASLERTSLLAQSSSRWQDLPAVLVLFLLFSCINN